MNRLKDIREDRDLQAKDVAAAIGVSKQAMSNYEKGVRQISPDLIGRFCAFYGVTADYLLGFSNQPQAAVSKSDTALLQAYHDAPAEIRGIVDHALEPYKKAAQESAAAS